MLNIKKLKYRFGNKIEREVRELTNGLKNCDSYPVDKRATSLISKMFDTAIRKIKFESVIANALPFGDKEGIKGMSQWECKVDVEDVSMSVEDLTGFIKEKGNFLGGAFSEAIDGDILGTIYDLDLETIEEEDIEAWLHGEKGKMFNAMTECSINDDIESYQVSKITYEGPKIEGSICKEPTTFFDPHEKHILFKKGFARFIQKPMTVESDRDVARGINCFYFRKFFGVEILDETQAVFVDSDMYCS